MRQRSWKSYTLEFLSIFIAVISAFALNNWNENRRDRHAEYNILAEISNGLQKDIQDIQNNAKGHRFGMDACTYWRQIIQNEAIDYDLLPQQYIRLTRDFISVQNRSGYETLKSRGLELIKDDSLRLQIITLYEYDYNTLRKMEEEYRELQLHQSYYRGINEIISPHLIFDNMGELKGIQTPLKLRKAEQKRMLSFLWKINLNRKFILGFYGEIEKKVERLNKLVSKKLSSR